MSERTTLTAPSAARARAQAIADRLVLTAPAAVQAREVALSLLELLWEADGLRRERSDLRPFIASHHPDITDAEIDTAVEAWLARDHCRDCEVELDQLPDGDWLYWVYEDVWAAAGLPYDGGALCLACLGRRLGRPLRPDDFDWDVAINRIFRAAILRAISETRPSE
jgi:hypothetical protein